MFLNKTFRYLLKPKADQRQKCANFGGAGRWIFNRGLARKKKAYEEEGKTLSYFDLNNELPHLKRQEETSWLAEIHSQILQQALKDLDAAYQHFFRRVQNSQKPGFPKFKRKGAKRLFSISPRSTSPRK